MVEVQTGLICDLILGMSSAMRRKDWAPAVAHWEAALALNPLNPDGWFAMGYACLKAEDDTRAVQVPPLPLHSLAARIQTFI